jgi:hypothetical protein
MTKELFPTRESENLRVVKLNVCVDIGWVMMFMGLDDK